MERSNRDIENSSGSNIPNLALMIRPKSFGFNNETALSNFFQQAVHIHQVAKQAMIEFDRMTEKLIHSGIGVLIFDDEKDNLPDSVFSNNWIAHFPENKIGVFPMFTPNRRAEVRSDVVSKLKELTKAQEVIDLRDEIENNNFLEGTGSMVLDYRLKIAYACASPRTTIQLFNRFCKLIDYTPFSFESFDIKGNLIYHTNVMMAIADKYALVCLESIVNPIEQNMLKQKIEMTNRVLIPISYLQMNQFLGNCIELNSRSGSKLVISKTALNCLTVDQKKQIELYSEIIDCEIPTIEKIGGGSVRCMITGIFIPSTK